jgi:hypothetical protein
MTAPTEAMSEKRAALLAEIVMVMEHIRDGREGHQTLLILRAAPWKLESLMEETSW